MKTLSTAALAAIEANAVVLAGAVRFSFGTTYRFWSGVGDLTYDSQTFTGVDAPAVIVPTTSEIGDGSSGVAIALSGLEPAIAASIEDEDYHQKPVVIWRLIFDAEGLNLLDGEVYFRGRVDTVAIREEVGGAAQIIFNVDGAGRDLDRRNARIRSNVDQRTLGGSTDGSMKWISTVGRRTLYWGRRPPATVEGNVALPRGPGERFRLNDI